MGGHVAYMGEINAYGIIAGNVKGGNLVRAVGRT
jgi:hypothetical protein